MRNLVFTTIFALILAAPAAQAEPPSMTTACLAPGACFVVNTSPCGDLMTVDNFGTVRMAGPADPILTAGNGSIHGVCGLYAPPYYTGVPRQQVPEAHCTGDNCGVNLHDLQ